MSDASVSVAPPAAIGPAAQRLRLWPAGAVLTVLCLARLWPAYDGENPAAFFGGYVIAPMVCVLLLELWWLFGSRLKWADRLLIVVALNVITGATVLIAGENFPALALVFYAAPVLVLCWTVWLILTQRMTWATRRGGLLVLFATIATFCCLLRLEGMDGTFNATFKWRWTPTAEQIFVAEREAAKRVQKEPGTASDETSPAANNSESKTSSDTTTTADGKTASTSVKDSTKPTILEAKEGDWPEFRGLQRDGKLSGVQIETDWSKTPPKEVWRHRIGPGWSSMTVVGSRLFTQEQRADQEFVVCYDTKTGNEIWNHGDTTRFYEVIAGAGPRATPTFYEGRLYTLGANGTLNCLDPVTGSAIWTSDIVADSGAKVPTWGFSGSPLVVQGIVSVFAGGPDGKSVLGYDADSGKLVWSAGQGALSYVSTHRVVFDGIEQILISTDAGLFSFDPKSGAELWKHEWPSGEVARVVQPAIIGESDILIGTGMGIGTRRISVKHAGKKWEVTEGWTSRAFKPYYNDFVVLGDYLYGFDRDIFMCVSVADGKIQWRARGYGSGQVMLLTDQSLLVIVTEQGEVALVNAKPQAHEELSKFQAIKGKTWNHPTIVDGMLFVRNAEEIAGFKLNTVKKATQTAQNTNTVAE